MLRGEKMDYVNGPGRNHLFVPGPVNIPEQVLRAMNRNNEDYRSPAVPALTKNLLEDVKKIFKTTSGTPFLFPTTGITVCWPVSYSLHRFVICIRMSLVWYSLLLISIF